MTTATDLARRIFDSTEHLRPAVKLDHRPTGDVHLRLPYAPDNAERIEAWIGAERRSHPGVATPRWLQRERAWRIPYALVPYLYDGLRADETVTEYEVQGLGADGARRDPATVRSR